MAIKRLDKLLADLGVATRSELRDIIRSGRVQVDGVTVTRPEQKFDSETCRILMDGQTLQYSVFHYYMMDKPEGVLSVPESSAISLSFSLSPSSSFALSNISL